MPIAKVIAGGQSGVDRAALDVAITLGVPYGGWCPAGGWAEDYPDPPGLLTRYPLLVPTETHAVATRTRLNVRDSNAALVMYASDQDLSPGTAVGTDEATDLGRPQLIVTLDDPTALATTTAFLNQLDGCVLSVGGPRESEVPGIYDLAYHFLLEALPRR